MAGSTSTHLLRRVLSRYFPDWMLPTLLSVVLPVQCRTYAKTSSACCMVQIVAYARFHFPAAIRGVPNFIAAHRCQRPILDLPGPSLRMGSKRHIESSTRPRWLRKVQVSRSCFFAVRKGVKTYQCMRCHTFRLRPRPPCALRYPHHEAPAFPSQVQTRENHAVQHHQMSVTHVSGFSLQSHNVVPDPVYDEGLTIILSSLLFHLLLQEVWQLSHLSPLTGLPPCHPFRPIPYI